MLFRSLTVMAAGREVYVDDLPPELRAADAVDAPSSDWETALARWANETLARVKPGSGTALLETAVPRFLVWRQVAQDLELAVAETPEAGWRSFGPAGSVIRFLRSALVRVLWCAVHPELGNSHTPAGWAHGQFANPTRLRCGQLAEPAASFLEQVLIGQVDSAFAWVKTRFEPNPNPFEQAALAEDLESLAKMISANQACVAANPPHENQQST